MCPAGFERRSLPSGMAFVVIGIYCTGHHFFSIHYRHWLERVIKTLLESKAHPGLKRKKKKSMQSSILNGCIYLLLIFSYKWFSDMRFRRCSRSFNLLQFWSNRYKTPEDSEILNSEVFWQTFVLIIIRVSVSLYNLKLIAQPKSSLPYWCSS